ncbi:MAG TPA: hemolysin III family channel protein, partial [Ruminococcaceae bacterium]|nr:hemolysin III family channel protein [Oscillospiraceae bacterium]
LFEKTKGIGLVMYLALGWMIIISIKTLWEVFSRTGVILLISGGIAYTLGAVLCGIGSKKRYFHTVFHYFIIIGSVLHFLAIFMYVLV